MAQALGVRFLDGDGNVAEIMGGSDLLKVKQIDDSGMDKRVRQIEIDVACNWKNVLCGDNGVARIFGPQKGATKEQVIILSEAMEHYANLIEKVIGSMSDTSREAVPQEGSGQVWLLLPVQCFILVSAL